MYKPDWSLISREDVTKAIDLFLLGNPEYPEPRSTFLLYNGKKLPAKHIRGMAYKVATNVEVSKADYSGGMETVRFFQKLGFEVLHIDKTVKSYKRSKSKPIDVQQTPVKRENCPARVVVSPKTDEIPDSSGTERIVIPAKGVIEQKNALQLILNRLFDGNIVCEKTFSWLKTPDTITDDYTLLYNALKGYRGNETFAKRNTLLRCDFVCESQKLIIEYDERQHFSEARRVALAAYQSIPTFFDKDLWCKACNSVQARDNQPANRDEVRAYYDSTRDIEAYKHGYKLVRIMHGQIDFERLNAKEQLTQLLEEAGVFETAIKEAAKPVDLKIALYLQADQWKNKHEFQKIYPLLKEAEYDILVFPEFCWVPFIQILQNSDIANADDCNAIMDACVAFSAEIGKAVVVSSIDQYNTIYSVFANGFATGDETGSSIYIKHTMTNCSAFEFKNYAELAKTLFTPILFHGYKIGLTICYDCTTALFSRMYGVQGVDLILNGTGGDVVYDKWYKFNQCRAIENHCFNLITMGGDGKKDKVNSYVYGFNRNGKEIIPSLLNGASKERNIPGGLYLFDLSLDDNGTSVDHSLNQFPTENKYKDFFIPVGNIDSILEQAEQIDERLFVYEFRDMNLVFVSTEGASIFAAEKVLTNLYNKKLNKIPNKRYILVCKYRNLDEATYRCRLSLILKVRAMENFCAVVLESNLVNHCYQTGKSRTAQVVKPVDGMYGLELSRMTGPEAIWKNKGGDFKASWRKGFETLVQECQQLSKE